jgi:CRISPR-associated protein Cas2
VTFVVLIAVAPGLRGHVTRWLCEVAAGVFVGTPSARVRERLWRTLEERVGEGQVVMVEPFDNEQGWIARTAGRDRYIPVDLDGLMLMSRSRR